MEGFNVLDELESVLASYGIAKENRVIINQYMSDEIKEDALKYLRVENLNVGKFEWVRNASLSNLFEKVSKDEKIYGKILRVFYYMFRTNIFKMNALKSQFYSLDKRGITTTFEKLRKFDLHPKEYLASFLEHYNNNEYNYIMIKNIEILNDVYEIDEKILHDTMMCVDKYGRKHIEACMLLKEKTYDFRFKDSNINLSIKTNDDKCNLALEEKINGSFESEKLEFEGVTLKKSKEDKNIRVYVVIANSSDDSFEDSKYVLDFFIQNGENEYLDFTLQIDEENEDVNLIIEFVFKLLETCNSSIATTLIRKYIELYHIYRRKPQSVNSFDLLFKLQKNDIIGVIDELNNSQSGKYMAYGILARNEGGEFNNLFKQELIELLKEEVFKHKEEINYIEFMEYLEGEKELEDIKNIPKIWLVCSLSLINNYSFIMMLINNLEGVFERIFTYLLYRENMVEHGSYYFMDRLVKMIGFNETARIIEGLDINRHFASKIILSYCATSYCSKESTWKFVSGVRKSDENVQSKVKEYVEFSVKNSKDKTFQKLKLVPLVLRMLVTESAELYNNKKITIENHKDILIKAVTDEPKILDKIVLRELELLNDENVTLEFLMNKKVYIREIGVLAAKKNKSPVIIEQLKKMVNKDRSSKLKQMIADILGFKLEVEEKEERGIFDEKVNKRITNKLEWLNVGNLPEIKNIKGEVLDDKYKYLILYEYSKLTHISNNTNKDMITEVVDIMTLSDFTHSVLIKWLEEKSETKNKWVLSLVIDFGTHDSIALVRNSIDMWYEEYRYYIAEMGLKTLALKLDKESLRILSSIEKKYKRIKTRVIAKRYMSRAATELGITKLELEELIVQNLEFDKYGRRKIEYGNRILTLELDSYFNINMTNDEGKLIKRLPKPSKNDDIEKIEKAKKEIKLIKKQLKKLIKEQTERLKDKESEKRFWQFKTWSKIFIDNVLFQKFAITLIWGIYENQKLIKTFRYMDEGSFVDVNEDDIEIRETQVIGLIEYGEMDENELAAWNQQLEDYEITQPINQMQQLN